MTPRRGSPVLAGSSQPIENIEARRLPRRLLAGSLGRSQPVENIRLAGSRRLSPVTPPYPHSPRERGRSLGSALPGGLTPLRRPFFCTSSLPGVCAHCREGTRADDHFADVHSSCHAAWRAALDLKESA